MQSSMDYSNKEGQVCHVHENSLINKLTYSLHRVLCVQWYRNFYSHYETVRGMYTFNSFIYIYCTLIWTHWKIKQAEPLVGPSGNEEKRNRGIVKGLKDAGDVTSQRKTTLERLKWSATILDGLVKVGQIAKGVCLDSFWFRTWLIQT